MEEDRCRGTVRRETVEDKAGRKGENVEYF